MLVLALQTSFSAPRYRVPTSTCASTYLFWCSNCSCEHGSRPLKAETPDTGFGNRLSKLLSFAAIGESLGRPVVTFWASPGNTNHKRHRGMRFYGSLDELRTLIMLPRALQWVEDCSANEANGSSTHSMLAAIPLAAADVIPTHLIKALQFGWGHGEGTWYYWQSWARTNDWPYPCVNRSTFLVNMERVFMELRPRFHMRKPTPRSYIALHWRRGDRGDVSKEDKASFNTTWDCINTLIQQRPALPWLVVSDSPGDVALVNDKLRIIGAQIAERPSETSRSSSSLGGVVRDFFAISASVGVLFSGSRFGPWVDSTFSSTAALVGDVPVLFPHKVAMGGNIAQLQALSNKSGVPLRSYFFADQLDSFLVEIARAEGREWKRQPANHPLPMHRVQTSSSCTSSGSV